MSAAKLSSDLADFFDFTATLSTIAELGFEGGSLIFDRCKDNALSRRTTGLEYKLVLFVLGRTSLKEWAKIPMLDFRRRTGASERAIYLALRSLAEKGFIVRDRRRGVKACPENFGDPPLPNPRTCRRKGPGRALSSVSV